MSRFTQQKRPYLRIPRDVTQVIHASSLIFHLYWRPMVEALAIVALPLLFISHSLQLERAKEFAAAGGAEGEGALGSYLIESLLPMIIYLGALTLVVGVVNEIILYHKDSKAKGGQQQETLTRKSLLRGLLKRINIHLSSGWMVSITYGLAVVAFFIILEGSSKGYLPNVLALFVPLLLCFMLYAGVSIGFTFIARLEENLSPLAALKRSFQLSKGKWWPCFGLLLCCMMVGTTLQGLPSILSMLLSELGSITQTNWEINDMERLIFQLFVSMLSAFASLVSLAFMFIAFALKYYALVELKEGVGVLSRIQEIGKKQSFTQIVNEEELIT